MSPQEQRRCGLLGNRGWTSSECGGFLSKHTLKLYDFPLFEERIHIYCLFVCASIRVLMDNSKSLCTFERNHFLSFYTFGGIIISLVEDRFMRIITMMALFLDVASMAMGEVSTKVCLADSNTPLELADPNIPFVYQDIMVGTKLTIIVDSNIAEPWDGGLFITGTDRDYGVLSGRDYNDTTLDWKGSRFEAVGDEARVYDWEDEMRSGFDLYAHRSVEAGDWFIIHYAATIIGNCSVGFYDYRWLGGMDFPVYDLVFTHVPTRDFNKDAKVDFADFAILTSHWQETGCSDPNWYQGTDLDADGKVDCNDLTLFMDYWLKRTE
jgi:hypothetical protein